MEHYRFIDDVMAKDDEITCTQLHKQLHEFFSENKVSLATVKEQERTWDGSQALPAIANSLKKTAKLNG